jgi:hypothetical protein
MKPAATDWLAVAAYPHVDTPQRHAAATCAAAPLTITRAHPRGQLQHQVPELPQPFAPLDGIEALCNAHDRAYLQGLCAALLALAVMLLLMAAYATRG